MSEQQATRLVQQAYAAFKAGDVPAFLSLLDDDVEWILPEMERVPFAGTWRGRQGVQKFFMTLAADQDVLEFHPEQFIAEGDTVVVLGRFAMRVKSTGRTSRSDWVHVWTIAGDKLTRCREYVDTAVVIRAHGAS